MRHRTIPKSVIRNLVRRAGVILIAVFPIAITSMAQKRPVSSIIVGPDILVSRDGDYPHFEVMASASPKDPSVLMAGSITYDRPYGGQACKVYTSRDGGYSWSATSFAEQVSLGGGDPQVAFSPDGTALFATMAWAKGQAGFRANVHVYRTEDPDAVRWSNPVELPGSFDHPQIIVDNARGTQPGKIYMGLLYVRSRLIRVGVVRSNDGGRTFTGPFDAVSGDANSGVNLTTPFVLSDRTLAIPFFRFTFTPPKDGRRISPFFLIHSADGGNSFSEPIQVAEQQHGDLAEMAQHHRAGSCVEDTFPAFVADNSDGQFHDRIYVAWNDHRFGASRILFSRSTDRGKSWTKPTVVDPSAPATGSQFQPMIAVNNKGVIGLSWFDTRGFVNEKAYHEYFTASTNGGNSFLPAVRVSSEPSLPTGLGNLTPTLWHQVHDDSSISFRLTSEFSFKPAGGDYVGLTADLNGTFHPVWVDSRTGTAQLWTARIDVETDSTSDAVPAPTNRHQMSIAKDIEFVFDPARYDRVQNVVTLPVRLKNTSQRAIYKPISVTITELVDPATRQFFPDQVVTPEILNAQNAQKGEGATFDYSSALGSLDVLQPGAITAAVNWKMKLPAGLQTNYLFSKSEVTGYVPDERR